MARRLGRLGGSGSDLAAANLGVDYTAGRALRTTRGNTKLKARIGHNLPRLAKIYRLAKTNRKAASSKESSQALGMDPRSGASPRE